MTTTARLHDLAKGLRITVKYGANLDYEKQDEWQQRAHGYHCTLKYKGRQYSFDFWQGEAITEEPTAEGTLECLLSDAQAGSQDFEEFCGDMGYDTDSRKAERTWKACQKVSEGMQRLLGDDYETFLYSDRN